MYMLGVADLPGHDLTAVDYTEFMITSAVTQVDSVPICHYMHEPITMISPNRLCNLSQHVLNQVNKELNLCCNESPFVVKLFLAPAILQRT